MTTKKTVMKLAGKTDSKAISPKTPAKKVTTKKAAARTVSTKKISKKEDLGLPLSVVIRRRIEAQKARFHANDNIYAFIKPGELEGLVDEVAEKCKPY